MLKLRYYRDFLSPSSIGLFSVMLIQIGNQNCFYVSVKYESAYFYVNTRFNLCTSDIWVFL